MADTLSINILAEIKDAVKSIQDFSNTAQSEFKQINSSVKLMETGIKAVGGVLAAAFTVGALSDFVHEAIQAQDEIDKLSNALKLTGQFSESLVKQFEDLASETLQMTGANDEAVLSQITYLKTLGATNKEVEKIIKVARDLSVVQGTDLASSVDTLVASYSGNTRALGKQFKEIKNFTQAQLESGAAIDFLNKKLDGFAKGASNTLGVQLKVLGENFNNLKEAIGRAFTGSTFVSILQAINSAVLTLTNSIKSLLSGSLDPLAQTVVRVASALTSLFIISKLPTIFLAASSAVEFLTINLSLLQARTGLGAFGALIGLVKQFTSAIFSATTAVNLLKASATIGITLLIDQFVKGQLEANSFADGIKLTFGNLKNLFVEVFAFIQDGLAKVFDLFSNIPGSGTFFKDQADLLRNSSKQLRQGVEENKKSLESLKKPLIDVGHASENLSDKSKGLGGVLEETLKKLRDFVNNIKKDLPGFKVNFLEVDYKKNLKELEDALKYGVIKKDEFDQLKLALEEKLQKDIVKANRDAVEEQIKEYQKLSNVLKGGDFKEFAKEFQKNPLKGSITLGLDISNFALQGQKGAVELGKNLVQSLAKSFGPFFESLAPGFAQAFEVLSQGKEKVAELVNGFIQGIPVIVQNVITAIPTLLVSIFNGLAQMLPALISQVIPQAILEFVNRLPEIVTALANAMINVGASLAAQMPLVATKLSISLTAQSPTIARSIIVEMVRNIPLFVAEAGKELAKGVKDALASIGGITGIGGGGGGILGGITGGLGKVGKVFGFADGIGEIPSGFPRDSFAAGLTSGERVVDAESNNSLKKFLSAFEQGKINSNQPLTVNIQVGEAQLAQVMLNLNRQGFRLS